MSPDAPRDDGRVDIERGHEPDGLDAFIDDILLGKPQACSSVVGGKGDTDEAALSVLDTLCNTPLPNASCAGSAHLAVAIPA